MQPEADADTPFDAARDPQSPAPDLSSPAPTASHVRRLLAIAGAALAFYVVASAAIVYVFGVKRIGYFFFDLSDIEIYFRYAFFMAGGGRPYVDFPVEYPPLALTLFKLAGPPDHIDRYAFRFALEMLLFGAAAAIATAATAARAWEAGRRPFLVAGGFSLGVAAIGALLANRYDAAVALVFATCLLFLVHGWTAAAAIALGIGFALKLVPAVLLPLVLILAPSRNAALRAAAGFAAAAALPFLPYLPEGLPGLAEVFAYHGKRPLQIESVLATPIWIGQVLGMVDVRISTGFGSQNVVAPGADGLAAISTVLGLAAIALTVVGIWRRRARLRETPRLIPLAAASVLLSFIVFGKVLSPQFLIWLLPCVALLLADRRPLAALLLAAMALTQVEFPANYFNFTGLEPAAIACVIARNALLAGAFALSAVQLWRIPAGTRSPTAG